MEKVQLVGVARLHYRPETQASSAWAEKQEGFCSWINQYRELLNTDEKVPDKAIVDE